MAKDGKNLTYLRASNQGAVLNKMLLSGPCTRLELTAALNLTSMSISNITSDLLSKGIISEVSSKSQSSLPGRRSSLLSISTGKVNAIGISIFRRLICFTLADITGKTECSFEIELENTTTQEKLTKIIIDNTEKILKLYNNEQILGIGISAVGIVDSKNGTLRETTDFFGVRDWNICDILFDRFNIPTYIVEDMKASALAESYYGAAKNYTDFVYLGITHGIGIGVINNGKLFEGHNGFSGEIGHMTLYRHGLLCPCGNTGCMEMYLSVPVVLKNAGLSSWNEFLALCEKKPDNPTVKQFLDDLGIALVTITNLFDPQAIIIGHEGAMLSQKCFDILQSILNEKSITRRIRKTNVHPSLLAHRIAYLNAPSVIFSRLFLGDFKL